MALSPAVRSRREKGKLWTNRIALYLLISTPIMILLWQVRYYFVNNSLYLLSYGPYVFLAILPEPLLLLNPFSIMVTSFTILPIPQWFSAIVVLSLVILPFIGCRLLNRQFHFGRTLYIWTKIATLAINVFLIFFMFYSMYWVQLSIPMFLFFPVICIVLPAIELYLVSMWVPKEAIQKKKMKL